MVEGLECDPRIENVFGKKVALCFLTSNWLYKEEALKFLVRKIEKYLSCSEKAS